MTTATFDPLDHVTHRVDLEALHDVARACAARQASRHARPTAALEVGSWAGSSALVLEGVFDRVFCVDTWEGTTSDRLGGVSRFYGRDHIFRTFCRNMGTKLHATVFPCVGKSLFWASAWRLPLDLIFIDADHTFDACITDLTCWTNHVAPGATICGHDYGSFEGVTTAVDRVFPERKLAGLSLWYKEFP